MRKTLELAYVIVGDECGQKVQRICNFKNVQRVIQGILQEEARTYEMYLTEEAERLLAYVQSLSPADPDPDYGRWDDIKTLEEAKAYVHARLEADRQNHWSGDFRYAQKVIARKGERRYTEIRIHF